MNNCSVFQTSAQQVRLSVCRPSPQLNELPVSAYHAAGRQILKPQAIIRLQGEMAEVNSGLAI